MSSKATSDEIIIYESRKIKIRNQIESVSIPIITVITGLLFKIWNSQSKAPDILFIIAGIFTLGAILGFSKKRQYKLKLTKETISFNTYTPYYPNPLLIFWKDIDRLEICWVSMEEGVNVFLHNPAVYLSQFYKEGENAAKKQTEIHGTPFQIYTREIDMSPEELITFLREYQKKIR